MQLDLLALLLLPAAFHQQHAPVQVPDGPRGPREMILGLEPGTRAGQVLLGSPLVAVEGAPASPSGSHLLLIELPADMDEARGVLWLDELRSRDGVSFAEWNGATRSPDLMGCRADGGPSSQGCTQAFYDGFPSLEAYEEQPLLQAIGAPFAHRALGSITVVVAVIDTGADLAHPALEDRVFGPGYDFVTGREGGWDVADATDTDGDGLIDEAFGHGTHVASTIALVNPNARLLPIRVLDSDGNGSAFALAQAIHYAVASGAEVINLSLAMHGRSIAVAQALAQAGEQGVDVVAAAGNTAAEQVLFPANHPDVLAVAAVGFDDRHASFSAFGELVSLAAPGEAIYGAMPEESYAWWSGTSMAAAVVSGSLSLSHSLSVTLMSQLPPRWALLNTCRPVDSFNPGVAGLLGAGRVDARGVTRVLRHP